MPGAEHLMNILGLASILAIFSLSIALVFKMERIKELTATVNKLRLSLDEMDEQAKLIVRTDMELNKTQEELDKKIIGLYALQRLSRSISTTLEEKQLFKMIEPAHVEELGFEKACGFLWEEKGKSFLLQINIGYAQDEMERIKSFIAADRAMFLELMKNEKVASSISTLIDTGHKETISRVFGVKHFIISPVLPKEGDKGFLFVGTQSSDTIINEGDEELITILTNQLGEALENARLFEKTWRAQQDLEKKVEERTHELRLVLDEVKIISKRKTDFISAVSHELRTPLTSIKGYASILLSGKLGQIPEEVRLRLEKMNRHSDELTHLVNDLLDIARIESGKIIMKREPLDLKNIIEGVSDLLSPQFKEKQIDFNYNIGDNANVIFADRSQIERVFINIIANALKFTPQKGKISIVTHRINNTAQVDVSDTGCGIPEEAQEAIFEEFYRVDNLINQETKGTGLGLSLVKHIVQAHSGKIWVKSKIGAGSTFSFTLPLPA